MWSTTEIMNIWMLSTVATQNREHLKDNDVTNLLHLISDTTQKNKIIIHQLKFSAIMQNK